MSDDLIHARGQIAARQLLAETLIERSIAAVHAPPCAHAFTLTSDGAARESARAADRATAAGRDAGRLAGLAVSIKDLFDVEGQTTSAGSKLLADALPAERDAPAVARLRGAGAAFVGRSNMSEFAFSGVGINPHFGTPANATTRQSDATPRIPGGSTSGGAVSVAAGAAWAALGSDTGGSIRIPAALHGLVGFKPTAHLVPTTGAVPLSTTLDSIGAITRSVRDAILLHEILAERSVAIERPPLEHWRFAIATTLMQDDLDPTVGRAFERAIAALGAAGARIETTRLSPLGALASINAAGGFAAAESWAWHRQRLGRHEKDYDPRVARRIRRGEAINAADFARLVAKRKAWTEAMARELAGFDAVLSPTVAITAPPLAPLIADDDAFFAANALLLCNPSAINFLDGCALTLPCHAAGELPVGLMVWHGSDRDDAVLSAGLAIEAVLAHHRAGLAPQAHPLEGLAQQARSSL